MKKTNQKGITLIALLVTVIVLGIIAGTTAYTVTRTPNADKLNNMYSDIYNLNNKIVMYYSNNNKLPILNNKVNLPEEAQKNLNDNENYYVIDLSQLENLTLNYGKDFSNYILGKDDVYIINEKSHTIYYLKGINFQEKNYYTVPENYEQIEKVDYFSKFITEWTVEDNGTITLPIKGVCNFNVDWGDGTQNTINSTTAETDVNRKHTYKTAGTYTVKIEGKLQQWDFSSINESKDKITKIVQWGSTDCKLINFKNCVNLYGNIPDPNENSFQNVTSFANTFNGCSSLIGIAPDLWNKYPNADGTNCFTYCTNLTNYNQIPKAWGGGLEI